ncbi:MAG: very short patch repair endonuclease, partial [Muribaculaceae bacterium]|nr:very short patch repair endonuclease [Muribaculaceae bacterium]
PEERSRNMAAIKGKDTKPELIVRKYLFSKDLRYRVNNQKLPGSPDIVLRKYKTVVFIDGCFWHGHEDCRYFRLPKSNVNFWRHKIAMNIARDYSNNVDLKLAGWRVIRIWECEIKTKANRENTLLNLYRQIIGMPNYEKSYAGNIDIGLIAADSDLPYGK